MNFDELVAQSEAVRRRRQEREARQAAMMQQRLRDVKQEMNGLHWNVIINFLFIPIPSCALKSWEWNFLNSKCVVLSISLNLLYHCYRYEAGH